MDDKLRDLIFQAIDQTISQEDFQHLQDALERDEAFRREYLKAVHLCESLGEISADALAEDAAASSLSSDLARGVVDGDSHGRRLTASSFAIAATILVLVSGVAFMMGRNNVPAVSEKTDTDDSLVEEAAEDETTESRISGHATLRRAVDVKWSEGAVRRLEGDILPNGVLAFDEGIAEIDFFCGATLIVEGPAQLDIESDWSVGVSSGRLRANVPPAARGFVVKAAGAEIVDLGTEFALEVGSDNARVEVIDGEIKLLGGQHDGKHLLTGEGELLKGRSTGVDSFKGLSTARDVQRRLREAELNRFAEWKSYTQSRRKDERLIAYFPIAESQSGRIVRNVSAAGSERDGLLVGPVDRTVGRFGARSSGLEFDRPGARVRTRIDGEFEAFTFSCWVRIDSLEHRYNALFMADSYQNGEPHWQIRDDGSLMMSVMVDDTQQIEHFSELENRVVKQGGLHRIYYTEPFWDISKSGQWFHLAAVYDPASRRVEQYVNGEPVSSEEIVDKFFVDTLRIGPSEIGNWGQPLRETPAFAVRNLNGTIDELAIYNAALNADEIAEFYQQGKPLGY